MQAAIAYIRKELLGHFSPGETEALIRFFFSVWKGYSSTDLLLNKDRLLTGSEQQYVREVTNRLLRHEPIQYILGETEFYGLPFRLNSAVLIPRPETEELVDWILKSTTTGKAPTILDAGTGSGCIAVCLKKHLPQARILACDISEEALDIAMENARRNRASVEFFRFDLLQPQANAKMPVLDIIVSNPPYVTEGEKIRMQDNVLRHEPAIALFVPDEDPMKYYRALSLLGKKLLKPEGRQFWEINEQYGEDCVTLLRENGYEQIELRRDVNNRFRMIAASCRKLRETE
ncbi:MAG: peptide chain release factor N(5)-glutamine methyltransferase [Mangrovibacterium sp.]